MDAEGVMHELDMHTRNTHGRADDRVRQLTERVDALEAELRDVLERVGVVAHMLDDALNRVYTLENDPAQGRTVYGEEQT